MSPAIGCLTRHPCLSARSRASLDSRGSPRGVPESGSCSRVGSAFTRGLSPQHCVHLAEADFRRAKSTGLVLRCPLMFRNRITRFLHCRSSGVASSLALLSGVRGEGRGRGGEESGLLGLTPLPSPLIAPPRSRWIDPRRRPRRSPPGGPGRATRAPAPPWSDPRSRSRGRRRR